MSVDDNDGSSYWSVPSVPALTSWVEIRAGKLDRFLDRLDLYGAVFFAVALFFGLIYLAITDEFGSRFHLVVIGALDVVLIVALSLASRVSVFVSPEGFMIRRPVGERVVPWSEVVRFEVKPAGEERPSSRLALLRRNGRKITVPGFRFRREQRNVLSLLARDLNELVAFYGADRA